MKYKLEMIKPYVDPFPKHIMNKSYSIEEWKIFVKSLKSNRSVSEGWCRGGWTETITYRIDNLQLLKSSTGSGLCSDMYYKDRKVGIFKLDKGVDKK